MSVLVIAEAGVNHNGDAAMAVKLIDAAAEAGADAVKFQTFSADEVAVPSAPKAAYQMESTAAAESQLDMIRKLELDRDAHRDLLAHSRKRASLDFLVKDMKLDTLKIPSGEITNGPMLLAAGRSGCAIILSTGMATLDEIGRALGVLAFSMAGGRGEPTAEAFAAAFASPAGRDALARRVTLLHCTTAYPTPYADANLRAMATMRDAFGLAVGYSDHTPGIAVAAAAVALGARVIEKHFTLDRTLPGPDHKASLEPGELKAMIGQIRAVEDALGDGDKAPAPSERANMDIARKSLVTLKPVKAGEPFTTDNLGIKRPGGGVSPMEYWRWLGRPAPRDFPAGALVGE